MKNIQVIIESLLFISIKPLTSKNLIERTGAKKEEVEQAIEAIMQKYNQEGYGVRIQKIDDKVQMVTAPESAELVKEFMKDETTGELTPASLETLTVIAYRGPINKHELELIRGVNCSLILRNLLMRGLIEEKKNADELLTTYQVTFDFLKYLGINETSELPDFNLLNSNDHLQQLLNPQAVQDELAESTPDTSTL